MMNIKAIAISLPVLAILAFSGAVPAAAADAAPIVFKQDKLFIQTKKKLLTFSVELARTSAEQEQGLKRRKTLEYSHGMLFVPEKKSRMMMWMKETYISLDMFFIDEIGQIIYIASRVKPNSTDIIAAKAPVRAVLEVPAGTARALGIRMRDIVIHPYFGNEKLVPAGSFKTKLPPKPKEEPKPKPEADSKKEKPLPSLKQ